jgi:hypothetical protein
MYTICEKYSRDQTEVWYTGYTVNRDVASAGRATQTDEASTPTRSTTEIEGRPLVCSLAPIEKRT